MIRALGWKWLEVYARCTSELWGSLLKIAQNPENQKAILLHVLAIHAEVARESLICAIHMSAPDIGTQVCALTSLST